MGTTCGGHTLNPLPSSHIHVDTHTCEVGTPSRSRARSRAGAHTRPQQTAHEIGRMGGRVYYSLYRYTCSAPVTATLCCTGHRPKTTGDLRRPRPPRTGTRNRTTFTLIYAFRVQSSVLRRQSGQSRTEVGFGFRGRSAGTATRAVSRARSLHGRRGRHRHACVLAVAFESRLMRIHYNIAAANVTRGAQWSGAHAT
jgi:hypothetical protein